VVEYQVPANQQFSFEYPGNVNVNVYVTNVHCGSTPCEFGNCSTSYDFTVKGRPGSGTTSPGSPVEHEPGSGGGITETPGDTIRRPPVPENPRVPPPEKTPPDSLELKECADITKRIEAALAIDLGMVLDEPSLSPYPRAVPLRAEGVDLDLAIFECSGCKGNESLYEEIVEDRMDVDEYEWTLKSGLGSLMSPFKADSIQSVLDSLKKIDEREIKILDRIEVIDERLSTGIEADSILYSSKLAEATSQRELQDSLYSNILVIKEDLEGRESELETTTELIINLINAGHDSISENIVMLDTLQNLLLDKPGAEELQIMQEVHGIQEELHDMQRSLENLDSLIILTSTNLTQGIAIKDSLLLLAMDNFDDLKNDLEFLNRAISSLETQLYSNPLIRAFLIRKREWNSRSKAFLGNYADQNSSLWEIQSTIRAESQQLLVAVPSSREELYTPLHNTLSNFTSQASQLCNGQSSEAYDYCLTLRENLIESALRFDSAMFDLSYSTVVVDPQLIQELEDKRQSIAGSEAAVQAARENVNQKSAAYEDAIQNYITTITQMEQEKTTLAIQVDEKADELKAKEIELGRSTATRKTNQEEQRPAILNSIAQIENKIVLFNRDIAIHSDSTQQLNLLMEIVQDSLSLAITEEKKLKIQVERLTELENNLTAILADLAAERGRLNSEKIALLAELEALKKLKEELTKTLATLNQPSKSASGPLVYYNPPPLEEVMKEMGTYQTFLDLVEARDTARSERDNALLFKEKVQALLVKETDKLANNLMKFKKTSASIEQMKEEQIQLEADKASEQQEEGLQQLAPLVLAEQMLNSADSSLSYHQNMVIAYLADSVQTANAIVQKNNELNALNEQWAQAEEALSTLYSQLNYQDGLLKASAETLRLKTEELDALNIALEELKTEKGRLLSKISSAEARGDDAASQSASNELNAVSIQITNKQSQINAKTSQVNSASQSFNSNRLAYENANEAIAEAENPFIEIKTQRRKANDDLAALNQHLKTVIHELRYHRSKVFEFELSKAQAQRAKKQAQEELNDAVNSSESVSTLTEQIAEIKENIEKGETKLDKTYVSIGASFDERTRLLELAKDSLQHAIDNLLDKEKELKDWVNEQFEKVKFECEIELVGDDEVVDQWRADDPRKKLTRKLSYKGSRIPDFQSKYASGSIIANAFLSICNPVVSFKVAPEPPRAGEPFIAHHEPRNIALVFEEGRLLWQAWPVIPDDKPRPLALDLLFVESPTAMDNDEMEYLCIGPSDCQVFPPSVSSIVDVGTRSWNVDGKLISANQDLTYGIWEPEKVPIPMLNKPQKLDHSLLANDFAPDPKVDYKSKPLIYPGTLIEVPDTLFGIPDTTMDAIGRVVAGNHKGLAGETVEFSVELIAGEANGYGFGGDTLKTQTTNGDGYALLPFDFGEGYAKFLIHVKWLRGDAIVEQDEFYAISPLSIQFLRISSGQPEELWVEGANRLVTGKKLSKAEVISICSNLPNCDEEDENSVSPCAKKTRGIAGLFNHHRDYVNGELIKFETDLSYVSLTPAQDSTKWFGFTRTTVDSIGEGEIIQLTAQIEDKYTAIGRPASDELKHDNSQLNRFKIGKNDELFIVELDEGVSRSSAIDGVTGRLVPSGAIADGILLPLFEVPIIIREVELDEADEPTALTGYIVWAEEGGVEKEIRKFKFSLDSLYIRAALGAGISGKVGHTSLPEPVGFNAELSTNGDFLGTIDNLPELEFMDFKLKKGASVTLDMHSTVGGEDIAPNFKGIIINTASLELPESFQKENQTKKSTIHVKNFYAGSSGIGGEIALTGTFVSIAYAGYELEADSLYIKFTNQELEALGIYGSLQLARPFEGKIECGVSMQGENYVAEVSTANPIYIPRLKAAFSLLSGTKLEYEAENKIGILTLNANLTAEKIDNVKVLGLVADSKGNISVDEIAINQDVKFGSGFNLHLNNLSFKDTLDGYMLKVRGGFGMPLIGIDKMSGTVAVIPGPEIQVRLDSANIHFENSAVKFSGGFAYSGDEFRGEFSIGIKKLLENGIEGLFIIGSKPIPQNAEERFTYWYVELTVGTKIPLGQTGLSLLKLGGGVGYHYIPPIGGSEGAPSYETDFAFKAIIGLGNSPGGEVFEGEMQMVLAGQQFSLYGKVWLLQKQNSMFGEGQLDLSWAGEGSMDGFVRMFIGLPDAKGKLLSFDGKILFHFAGTDDWYVKSESIEGRAFNALEASGVIDIGTDETHLNGRLYYGLDKTFGFGVVDVIVVFKIDAGGQLDYVYSPFDMRFKTYFEGYADIDLDTPLGTADLLSANLGAILDCRATSSQISVTGELSVSYDVWIYADTHLLDIGYTSSY